LRDRRVVEAGFNGSDDLKALLEVLLDIREILLRSGMAGGDCEPTCEESHK
jgi:hypothetical protein